MVGQGETQDIKPNNSKRQPPYSWPQCCQGRREKRRARWPNPGPSSPTIRSHDRKSYQQIPSQQRQQGGPLRIVSELRGQARPERWRGCNGRIVFEGALLSAHGASALLVFGLFSTAQSLDDAQAKTPATADIPAGNFTRSKRITVAFEPNIRRGRCWGLWNPGLEQRHQDQDIYKRVAITRDGKQRSQRVFLLAPAATGLAAELKAVSPLGIKRLHLRRQLQLHINYGYQQQQQQLLPLLLLLLLCFYNDARSYPWKGHADSVPSGSFQYTGHLEPAGPDGAFLVSGTTYAASTVLGVDTRTGTRSAFTNLEISIAVAANSCINPVLRLYQGLRFVLRQGCAARLDSYQGEERLVLALYQILLDRIPLGPIPHTSSKTS
ncbi:hypothetical protein HL42_5377 [Trichophyton rubrum]|nr:hypothetical protein HL42_5377 [Trichophyton rubrum]